MAKRRGEQGVRPERVAEQLRMDTCEILQNDVKDPRVRLVTCTRVHLTKDLRYAKLYVSVLGDEKEREAAMRALERATGFVRRRLSEKLRLRASPEIHFVYDPSVEYSIRLERLIEETKAEGRENEVAPEEDRARGGSVTRRQEEETPS